MSDFSLAHIARMSDDALAALPADNRLAIFDVALASDDPRRHTVMRRLYRSQPLDPAFLHAERRTIALLFEALGERPDWPISRKDWQNLGPTGRQKVLQDVASLYSGLSGHTKAPRLLIDTGDRQKLHESAGFYKRNKGLIVIKEAIAGTDTDFAAAVAITLHETSHHHQALWCDQLHSGLIGESHPFYHQIRWFDANYRAHAYVEASLDSLHDYRAQPLERHAFQIEQWAQRRLGPLAHIEASLGARLSGNDNQPRAQR